MRRTGWLQGAPSWSPLCSEVNCNQTYSSEDLYAPTMCRGPKEVSEREVRERLCSRLEA